MVSKRNSILVYDQVSYEIWLDYMEEQGHNRFALMLDDDFDNQECDCDDGGGVEGYRNGDGTGAGKNGQFYGNSYGDGAEGDGTGDGNSEGGEPETGNYFEDEYGNPDH